MANIGTPSSVAGPPGAYGQPVLSGVTSPVSGAFAAQSSAPGAPGVTNADIESQKYSYSYATASFTAAATPTDILEIIGNPGVVTRIKNVQITALCTAAANSIGPVQIIRRSVNNTGSGSTTVTPMKRDFSDPAASSTVKFWTTNPTQGATTGVMQAQLLAYGNVTVTTGLNEVFWDFSVRNDKAIVLRGATDSVTLNLAGATLPTGASFTFEVAFTEEPVGT